MHIGIISRGLAVLVRRCDNGHRYMPSFSVIGIVLEVRVFPILGASQRCHHTQYDQNGLLMMHCRGPGNIRGSVLQAIDTGIGPGALWSEITPAGQRRPGSQQGFHLTRAPNLSGQTPLPNVNPHTHPCPIKMLRRTARCKIFFHRPNVLTTGWYCTIIMCRGWNWVIKMSCCVGEPTKYKATKSLNITKFHIERNSSEIKW